MKEDFTKHSKEVNCQQREKSLQNYNCHCRTFNVCEGAGIGRQNGLKIRRAQALEGSSPFPRTKINYFFI